MDRTWRRVLLLGLWISAFAGQCFVVRSLAAVRPEGLTLGLLVTAFAPYAASALCFTITRSAKLALSLFALPACVDLIWCAMFLAVPASWMDEFTWRGVHWLMLIMVLPISFALALRSEGRAARGAAPS